MKSFIRQHFCSVKPAAERCLDLFVRFACLIRPIGTLGRLKLAADFAQVQIYSVRQFEYYMY